MTALGFIITLAVSTTAIGMLMLVCAYMMPRVRNWPLFWAVGIIAGVATAVLAATLSKFGIGLPQFPRAVAEFNGPLAPVNWPALTQQTIHDSSGVHWASLLPTVLIAIYVIGLVVSLLRLGLGRYRAARIAHYSTEITLDDGTNISLTPEPFACITMTPFGCPNKSRIIVSDEFYAALTPSELRDIIQHEKGHIRRRDDEVGVILRGLVALSWFNPLSHILFDRWMMSAELQCDQAVTKHHSHPMRRAYANTLLKALHISGGQVQQYPAASLSTHRIRNEKMRISHMMQGSAPTFKHIGPKLLLLITAAALSLTGAITMSATATAETPLQADTPQIEISETETAQAEIILTADISQQHNNFVIEGTLTSSYGATESPFKKGVMRDHYGVDFKAPSGTPIYAPADGVITEATALFNNNANYGKVVVLQTEGGVQTMLAHLNSYDVAVGQTVLQGQKIAEIGSTGKSTGPHVHIETRRNGKRVDPMSVWTFNK